MKQLFHDVWVTLIVLASLILVALIILVIGTMTDSQRLPSREGSWGTFSLPPDHPNNPERD